VFVLVIAIPPLPPTLPHFENSRNVEMSGFLTLLAARWN
jgi:hypothetical protein